MNRRSFLARFVGGLAAISLRLEEVPKIENRYIKIGSRVGKCETTQWNNYDIYDPYK